MAQSYYFLVLVCRLIYFKMNLHKLTFVTCISICFLSMKTTITCAQDNRLQYPLLLQKAYFGVDVGALNYPFTNADLPAVYRAEKISIPHEAVRITLFGYHFTQRLSARITYMRPVEWVLYKNINGDARKHSVWMNIGELTVRQTIPLINNLSFTVEAGLAVITRHGFTIGQISAITDAGYATFTGGGGLQYHLNSKWHLNLYASYSPGKQNVHQPHTTFISGGFEYNINPLPEEKVKGKEGNNKSFPRQTFQFAYTTNGFGYGANHFFGEGKIPVFWGGNVAVEEGMVFNYRRNIFHTKKTFSLDIGGSIGSWESNKNEQSFFAVSVYPVMRFNVFRSELADLYFLYSVAGPSYISKSRLDDYNTGKHFTFRDYMGVGGYFGRHDVINAELNIGHFSNGNIFPANAGVKIPLSFTFGYAF